jgi:hypothetical protein
MKILISIVNKLKFEGLNLKMLRTKIMCAFKNYTKVHGVAKPKITKVHQNTFPE